MLGAPDPQPQRHAVGSAGGWAAVAEAELLAVAAGAGAALVAGKAALIEELTPELGLERFPDVHPDVVSVTPRGANVEGAGAITMGELGEWLLRLWWGRL